MFSCISNVCFIWYCMCFNWMLHMLHWLYTNVASVCFICFRCMLQAFYRYVSYVATIHVCCKCMFQMFHLFQTYVASVLSGYCIRCSGYTHMLQPYVSNISHVLDLCCSKCFILQVYSPCSAELIRTAYQPWNSVFLLQQISHSRLISQKTACRTGSLISRRGMFHAFQM
jgi:hypothetical protein